MPQSILIIDCTGKPFNAANHGQFALGGIERAVIQLAQALVRKGMDVTVWNDTPDHINAGGVAWIPKTKGSLLKKYDIVIACNDARLFDDYAKASDHTHFKPYLWFHNRVLLEKTVRKGRLMPMFRWRPVGVFLGKDHEATATKFVPLRRRAIIGSGVEDEVLNYPTSQQKRPPVAVFISQPYRGLAGMISLWRDYIHPAVPEARLRLYASELKSLYCDDMSDQDLDQAGIELRGRMPRKNLMKDLDEARVCLIPGHKDETFCLAAAESLALGIPVLSHGTGSLKERIADGANGYIVASRDDFAQRLKEILTDDALWGRLSAHGLPDRKSYGWDASADRWLQLFREENA